DRAGDRIHCGASALALDHGFRGAADECQVAELEQEEIRRGIDAPERAIELEGRRRRRPLRPLRDHDLEDVALADVFLRELDPAEVLVAVGEAPQTAAGAGPPRGIGLWPLEQARRLGAVPDQDLGDTARVVEADEELGHDETALIEARALHGERHRRLEARDDVVAEVADDRLPERLGLVEADEPRAATDERVPPEAPTLHRLEEK